MLTTIGKRLVTVIPTLIGVVIVTFLLTRVLPGDPAVYFAGPAATPQSIAEIRKDTRPRPAAARAVRPLCQRSGARQFRQFAFHRPAGGDRNHQPAAGIRRAHAVRADSLDRHRGAARHFRGGQARLLDRSFMQNRRHRRRFAAGVLHRPAAGLCLLLLARLGAGADRPARRFRHRAAAAHRLLSDRQPGDRKFRDLPRLAQPVDSAGGDIGDFLAGADHAHDARLDAGGAGVRIRAHGARRAASTTAPSSSPTPSATPCCRW